jgi:hypothetical protein
MGIGSTFWRFFGGERGGAIRFGVRLRRSRESIAHVHLPRMISILSKTDWARNKFPQAQVLYL